MAQESIKLFFVNAGIRMMTCFAELESTLGGMRDHTSLLAWQGARELVLSVYRLTGRIWQPNLAAMFRQLQRGLSVQLNLAEGYGLGTPAQFVRHLSLAYGSAIETVEIINLLAELCEKEAQTLQSMVTRANRNCALVLALKHSMQRRKNDHEGDKQR